MVLSFVSWKTTLSAILPIVAYAAKFAGMWPDAIPLPPIEQVWPAYLAILGVGFNAKDNNVTGGNIHQ